MYRFIDIDIKQCKGEEDGKQKSRRKGKGDGEGEKKEEEEEEEKEKKKAKGVKHPSHLAHREPINSVHVPEKHVPIGLHAKHSAERQQP